MALSNALDVYKSMQAPTRREWYAYRAIFSFSDRLYVCVARYCKHFLTRIVLMKGHFLSPDLRNRFFGVNLLIKYVNVCPLLLFFLNFQHILTLNTSRL